VQGLYIEALAGKINCGSIQSFLGGLQALAQAWDFNQEFDCDSQNGKIRSVAEFDCGKTVRRVVDLL
jgi:hypothetical protein